MRNRRTFLQQGSLLAAGFLGLRQFSLAGGLPAGPTSPGRPLPGFGPLVPDAAGIFDLPSGFSYRILSRQGDPMDDGLQVPGDPDGMAAFHGPEGRVILVRNHELYYDQGDKSPYGAAREKLGLVSPSAFYDRGSGQMPGLGGTTTVVFNPATGAVEKQFLSLAGTCNNCAGGPTPWGSWISCEETTDPAFEFLEKNHGYNFEVPARTEMRLAEPVPLVAMGRFRHEAVAVDPRSGIVYQTEDLADSLIYRFLPDRPGHLRAGGRLQALAIVGQPSRDTRNWPTLGLEPFPAGRLFDTAWIDLADVSSPDDSLRYQGFDRGAARFARGEGMWFGHGEVFFACTNGGPQEYGQVFRYFPSPYEGTSRESEAPGRLELFIQSSDPNILVNCDNLTLSPWGDLFICEDADTPCRLIGVTPTGQSYIFGHNPYSEAELAGACFSPDGRHLFLNIQDAGLTLAITGPWKGSLP